MSSRLTKSTSKFRPVKPQQKKGAALASSQPTPAASASPAPAPPPTSASLPLHEDVASSSATALATTNVDTADGTSRPPTVLPPSTTLSTSSAIAGSSTPILLTVPSLKPPSTPTVVATSSSATSAGTPVETVQPTQVPSSLNVPSSASSSRQGTPISSRSPGSSFISQSWQDLEATQVEVPSSTPIPDTQQTILPHPTQESSHKDRGKAIAPSLEPTIQSSYTNKESTDKSNEAVSIAVPASSAISTSEPIISTQTRDLTSDLQSSAPPTSLRPLSTGLVDSDGAVDDGTTQDGRGGSYPIAEPSINAVTTESIEAAPTPPNTTIGDEAPKGKKRGRPPGKTSTTGSKKAKAKKATPAAAKKAPKGKTANKKKKKMLAGGGAELDSDDQGENQTEAEAANDDVDADGEDDIDVETVIARAIAQADAQVQPGTSMEGNEATQDAPEGQEEGEESAESTTTSRPTAVKRKAATTKTRKKKKNKTRRTSTTGGENGEGEGENSDGNDEEYDEDGNLVIVPWEINKIRPGYSLSTEDIYKAVGVDPPGSFEFMTGQDEVEVLEEEEDEQNDNENAEEGQIGDETMEQDREDEEERQYEAEEDGIADPSGSNNTTIPWLPFSKPIDPTTTTMKQLTEDSGRGRMASTGSTSFNQKINRKQSLKINREKMKLRTALIREGIKIEAIDRVLNEKFDVNNINNGSIIVEFDIGDQVNPSSSGTFGTSASAANGTNANEDASRHGTPFASTSGSQQPLFRPEENSDDEDNQSRHHENGQDEQNGQEEGEQEGFDDIVESRYAPQMKLVNGEYVLDESSTQVVWENPDRDAYATVEDHPDGRKINSYTWSKRGKASRWTLADTDLFFEGLTQFGTDFELISRMFSNRTRRQIKAKFVREEKIDPNRIEESLSGKKKIDINFYERMTKLDFRNGIVPIDPMAKFYEDLPTLSNAVKLDSNREQQQSDQPEIDLVALLRKKKEDTAGLGNAWENSRPGPNHGGEAQDAIPEEEEEQEEGAHQPYTNDERGHDDEADEEPEYVEAEEQAIEGETSYRSPSPVEEEPFVFSGGVQLRVSG